jgi:hypothetical protein
MAQRAAAREQGRDRVAAQPPESDPHAGHHLHLSGPSIICSCGEFQGLICVALTEDYNPDALRCSICGAPGVVAA